MDLGTILLVPDRIPDTSLALSGFEELAMSARLESDKLRIYPNPTSGRMKFELPDRGVFDYTIFNHLGQPVFNGQIENGAEINLSNQPNGMYFIIVKDEEKFLGTRRIVVLSHS